MSTAAAPVLPGYDHVRLLGQGGFADVHLYRQHLPVREVAIKVLRSPAHTPEERARFENEANRMAALSSHPGIVTIYEVGVAPDERPYLTMEFCPNDHLGEQVRARPLTVARALEVGIKIAAAVETAHRAHILHRDLKPANILLTRFDEPALTDFGIAGAAGDGAESQGVSIAFGAPEVLRGISSGDQRSDLYSLGATVYALLAGRSPHSTGQPMTEAEHIARVLAGPPPPTGRPDVPPSLERVLAHALAADPAQRHASAAEFGRALQTVEAELGLSRTPLRITAEAVSAPPRRDDADEDRTRLRGIPRVDPRGPAAEAPTAAPSGAPPTAAPPSPVPTAIPATWSPPAGAGPADTGLGDRTAARARLPTAPAAPEPAPAADPAQRRRVLWAVAGAVILVVAVVIVLSRTGAEPPRDPTLTTADATPTLLPPPSILRPERVKVADLPGGGQLITWSTPGAIEGDQYRVTFTDGPAEQRGTSEVVAATELRLDSDRHVCVTVAAIRGDRVSDPSTEVCSR